MKVKAFTLMEMLLVMALTGLALAIAWGIYADFRLFGLEYEKRTSSADELSLLHEYLSTDTRRSLEVSAIGDTLALTGPRSTFYVRIPNGIVRTEMEHSDTFFLPLRDISLESNSRMSVLALHLGASDEGGLTLHYPVEHLPSAIQQ